MKNTIYHTETHIRFMFNYKTLVDFKTCTVSLPSRLSRFYVWMRGDFKYLRSFTCFSDWAIYILLPWQRVLCNIYTKSKRRCKGFFKCQNSKIYSTSEVTSDPKILGSYNTYLRHLTWTLPQTLRSDVSSYLTVTRDT